RSRAVERLEPAAEAAGPAGPAGNRDPRRASEAALGPDRAARADDARLAHGGADQRGQQLCLPPVLVTEGERLELVDALGVEPAGGVVLLRVAERADRPGERVVAEVEQRAAASVTRPEPRYGVGRRHEAEL